MSISNKKSSTTPENDFRQQVSMPLAKINFIMMACSAVLIIVGFLLMLGGSSTADEFNPDIFSTRRVVVGPTIAFIGFLAMGFAIIYRPKSTDTDNNE